MIYVKYQFVAEDVDRHGNVRIYFRRGKYKTRLRATPGTTEFQAEYDHALAISGELQAPAPTTPKTKRSTAGTWRWLCEQHFASGEFRQLEKSTQTLRRKILESTFSEPRAPGAREVFADCPIERMTAAAVTVLRDQKGNHFSAANNRVKAIHRVFSWAMEQMPPLAMSNPAAAVGKLRRASLGHHTWTEEEVAQYQARHGRGTKARLALALFMYTGQRKSDVVRLGHHNVTGKTWLRFTQYKNRNRSPVTLQIPILPVLQEELDTTTTGNDTFLVTASGRPFSINGFGNKFREWCDQAGLKHCSAHGLRKAGAKIAAENGATVHQLQAIFGWKTLAEAERYTKAADQKLMAGKAMLLLEHREER